jgi:Domain of unknown function (DUF5060)/Protein of unknown function (DUF4038)
MKYLRAALAGAFLLAVPLVAQPNCSPTPTFSPCALVFELNPAELAANPNPYVTVQIHAEFRSPEHRTYLMPGFWDGANRMVIRFSPTEPGAWVFRVTSNIPRFEGITNSFQATPSDAPGFVIPANLHHWATLNTLNPSDKKPHLWMGATLLPLGFVDRATFDQIVDARAKQGFTHIRGIVLGTAAEQSQAFPEVDRPNPVYFRELDSRIRYINTKGMVADLMLAGGDDALAKLLPNWPAKQRFIRYIVGHFAAMNVTWQGIRNFQSYANGRALMKDLGTLLKQNDPYDHPRSSGTTTTTSALAGDGWMNYMNYRSSDDQLGAIEHQLYGMPFVNSEPGCEDSGAGRSGPRDVDSDTFRHNLWNATMDGQYPTFCNTGTSGEKLPVSAKYADSPGARAMTAWAAIIGNSRHWEMEPYFDVDGGRAIALEGVEYIVYLGKPGPVEVGVVHHGYDVRWFNPITGEFVKAKDFKGQRFTGEPPDRAHDWVLDISREGHKQSMLKSYKFDSREVPLQLQIPETRIEKLPFTIVQPSAAAFSMSTPPFYSVKLKRETRATRFMMYLWTGEVVTEGEGTRVLGTGAQGTFLFSPTLAPRLPALLSLRVAGMNSYGKIYLIDKEYTLNP